MLTELSRAEELLRILSLQSDEQGVIVVSNALSRLRELATVDKETAVLALGTLAKLLRNIVDSPTEDKYKKIKLENKAINSR